VNTLHKEEEKEEEEGGGGGEEEEDDNNNGCYSYYYYYHYYFNDLCISPTFADSDILTLDTYHPRLATDIALASETLLKITGIATENSPSEVTPCYMISPLHATGLVCTKTTWWILLLPSSVLLFTMLRKRSLPVATTESTDLPLDFLANVSKRKGQTILQ
jgi:hypothetical protein